MKKGAEDGWRKPNLTVAGQLAFWDKVSEIYETADMTVDNQQEMEVVINHCREVNCGEIITLGGAVGCRDPKMILERLFFNNGHSKNPPTVVFNDLSPLQVELARTKVLKPLIDRGVKIDFRPGQIDIVSASLSSKPRRLIIGVYGCHSFFEAYPGDGYPNCGFDEYLKNSTILGEEFLFDWVKYSPDRGGQISSSNLRARVHCEDNRESVQNVKQTLTYIQQEVASRQTSGIMGLQIVGRHSQKDGFFLSHWYLPAIFQGMLEGVFPPKKFSIHVDYFAKGMVYTIDPLDREIVGIVTILNNVIGNILPNQQIRSLKAVRSIIE